MKVLVVGEVEKVGSSVWFGRAGIDLAGTTLLDGDDPPLRYLAAAEKAVSPMLGTDATAEEVAFTAVTAFLREIAEEGEDELALH